LRTGSALGDRPSDTPATLRLRRFQEPPRAWSPRDAFLYNLLTGNVAVFFGLPLVAGTVFYFPTRSMLFAILLTGAFCLLEAVTYAFLVSSMPRIGGDYVFQSRLLSQTAGSVFSLVGVVVAGGLWLALSGWFAAKLAVAPVFLLTGRALHIAWLEAMGQWLFSVTGALVLGLIAAVWSGLVNYLGRATYARGQRGLMAVGGLGLLVFVAYLALTHFSTDTYIGRAIVYRALELGYLPEGQSAGLDATLSLLPVVAFGLIYPGWVSFQAAEVRRIEVLRNQWTMTVGAKAATIAFALVLLPLPIRHLGEQLFGSMTYLAMHDPRSFWLLVPDLFGMNRSPFLSTIVIVSLVVAVNSWFWIWVPNHTLAASRVLLAMSWDGVMPQKLSVLRSRSGAPGYALAVCTALNCGIVALYSWLGATRLALHATLLSLLCFSVTCIAAALFPYLRRESYRHSTAAPYHIARLPLITVTSLLFTAFSAFLMWRYVRFEAVTQRVGMLETVIVVALLCVCAAVCCLITRGRRGRREGRDLQVFYSEREPEPYLAPVAEGRSAGFTSTNGVEGDSPMEA